MPGHALQLIMPTLIRSCQMPRPPPSLHLLLCRLSHIAAAFSPLLASPLPCPPPSPLTPSLAFWAGALQVLLLHL